MTIRCLAVLVCTVLGSWAQTAGAGSISGRVLNSLTGETIAGARVRVFTGDRSPQKDSLSATSQADGTFRLDSVSPGTYLLLVSKDGFASVAGREGMAMVHVEPDQVASGVELSLMPDGGISGTVLDDNSAPVAEVEVDALTMSGGYPPQLQTTSSHATTDASGHFSLASLPGGNYYLVAIPDPTKFTPRQDMYSPLPTFYPEAVAFGDAAPLLVRPADSVSAEIKLHFGLTHRVDGKLADFPDELLRRSVRLELAPRGADQVAPLWLSAVVRQDHTFSFTGVPSGQYVIKAEAGRRQRGALARQELEVGATDVSDVVLRPAEPVTVTGTVVLDDNVPSAPGTVTVRAVAMDGSRRRFSANTQNGSFSLSGLDPGEYFFSVAPSQAGLYVSSLTMNQRDILNQVVELSDTASGQITATLRQGTGDISGSVSQAPSLAILAPRSIAPDGSNIRVTFTQGEGTFDFANLPPGDYYLYAASRETINLWLHPAFSQALQNSGTAVHLDEGGRQQLKLSLLDDQVLRDEGARLGLFLESR